MILTHPGYDGFSDNYLNCKGGFLPAQTRILIIGTFPPPSVIVEFEKTHEQNSFFYYDSPRNHFWNRIEYIHKGNQRIKYTKKWSKSKELNIWLKKRICKNYGWGFMDVFSKVKRKVANSSKDSDLIHLEDVVSNGQLFNAIKALPNFKRICCVYDTALKLLLEKLSKANISIVTSQDDFIADRKVRYFNLEGKKIEIVLLYPATRSSEKKEIKNIQYKHFLTN